MNLDQLRSVTRWVGIAVLLASFALYLSTLAPTLTWGWDQKGVDGGELLVAAHSLGIPHPPGYPAYTLLLRSFATLVPIGDFAFRGNLLSAVLASLCVYVIYWVIVRVALAVKPGAPAGLAVTGAALGSAVIATSPLLWSQAVITEVYALNALFAALLLLLAARLALRSSTDGATGLAAPTLKLALFGLVLGIGLGNHFTLLAVAAPLLYWLWRSLGLRRLASPWMIIAFLLGISVYAYLPIRAAQDPVVNWGHADTLRGTVWMLTARPYQEYVFGVAAGGIASRLTVWAELVFSQFNPLGLFIGIMAFRAMRSRVPAFVTASLLSITLLSVYAIMYNTVDFEVLMIPAFLIFAIWLGVGFFWITSNWIPRVADGSVSGRMRILASRPALILGLLAFGLLPATSVALNYDSQDLSDDRSAYEHAKAILDYVPDGAVVVSSSEKNVFSLWYMRYVEEPERDVAVIAAPLLQFSWYLDDIHRMFPGRIPDMIVTDIQSSIDEIVEHNSGSARVFTTFWNTAADTRVAVGLYEAVDG